MRAKIKLFILVFGLIIMPMQSVFAASYTGAMGHKQKPLESAPAIALVSNIPLEVTPTPSAIPTSTRNAPPIWLTLSMLGFCCIIMLIFGVFTLGFFVRSQNLKAMEEDQKK